MPHLSCQGLRRIYNEHEQDVKGKSTNPRFFLPIAPLLTGMRTPGDHIPGHLAPDRYRDGLHIPLLVYTELQKVDPSWLF